MFEGCWFFTLTSRTCCCGSYFCSCLYWGWLWSIKVWLALLEATVDVVVVVVVVDDIVVAFVDVLVVVNKLYEAPKGCWFYCCLCCCCCCFCFCFVVNVVVVVLLVIGHVLFSYGKKIERILLIYMLLRYLIDCN